MVTALPLYSQQSVRFHPDPHLFIQEIEDLFGRKPANQVKQNIQELERLQRTGQIEENQWIDLASLANQLDRLERRPANYINQLIRSFCAVVTFTDQPEDYRYWSEQLTNMLSVSKPSLRLTISFLENTEAFVKEGILFKASFITWKTHGNIQFGRDTAFHFILRNTELIALDRKDSIVIFSTSGKYYPDHQLFVGKGGEITWEQLGIPKDQVKVRLNHYRLNLSQSSVDIDSVNLIDRRYFNEPILGRVENKILYGINPNLATYPKFTAYGYNNRIKNIFPEMDYTGGFMIQGKSLIGTGTSEKRSTLQIFREGTPLFRIAATHFDFQTVMARAVNAEATIYIESDSIFHPGILFQYNSTQDEVSLSRDGKGLSPSRFFDTYHDFDLDANLISWNRTDTIITISNLPGKSENRVLFESSDFFHIGRYNEILLADRIHPVVAIKKAADQMGTHFYTLDDLARSMEKPNHLVEQMLLRLSFMGFVRYNPDTKAIEVLDRSYNFIEKNATIQDYDSLRFESVTKHPIINARLDIQNGKMKVVGVQEIILSQTRNVIIYPQEQTVTLLKGRDILFDGEIHGGVLKLSGENFVFSYQDFAIRLNNLNQLNFNVFKQDSSDGSGKQLIEVASAIESTQGALYIDQANNKSGLKAEDYPEYPQFATDTFAYIYFDHPDIVGGAYPRESFYFRIDPFVMANMYDPAFADSLRLPGQFVTAGIFPPIELEMRYLEDHTMGFKALETPEEGIPVYNGKGKFFEKIQMSQAGLIGTGALEYLESRMESDTFLFLPDQVTSLVNTFAITQNDDSPGHPGISGEKLPVTWQPGQNKLIASSTTGPFLMYEGVELDGEIILTPKGLGGSGKVQYGRYHVTPESILFLADSFTADESLLKILGRQQDKNDGNLEAINFNASINLKNQRAQLFGIDTSSQVIFHRNQFKALPKSVEIDLDTETLKMESPVLCQARSKSDSLQIPAKEAIYGLSNNHLEATGVTFIDVADVRIYPDQEVLSISEGGKIDRLTNATMASRDTSLPHRFSQVFNDTATTEIYTGSGNYHYTDIAGRDFSIWFPSISSGDKGISSADGSVPKGEDFALSPAFRYYGEVFWDNSRVPLLFNGYAQMMQPCRNIPLQWIHFEDIIYPDSVCIPIDSTTINDEGNTLFNGFYLANQPVELYSTFAGSHLRYSDVPVLKASGKLWYDQGAQVYRITSTAKLKNPDLGGPLLTWNPGNCTTEATGIIDPQVDLGQVKIKGAGRLSHDLTQDTISSDLILTMDFYLDNKALEYMARSINSASTLEPVNYSTAGFRQNLRELAGKVRSEELLNQLSLAGRWRRIPEEFLHTLVFTDIQLRWNPETGTYQSVGKLGLGAIQGTQVNKRLNGYLEIVHRRGGGSFNLYLEIDRQGYFFFTYSRGVMQCISGPTFDRFNTLMKDVKESKRTVDGGPDEQPYQFYPGQERQVQEFLRRLRVER